MMMKYLLPLITGIAYVVSLLYLLKKKKKDNLRNFYCFILLTGFMFSLVESMVIDENFVKGNVIAFIALIILNSLNCLLKSLTLAKSKENELSKNFMLFDQLSIVSIVLLIIVLRLK